MFRPFFDFDRLSMRLKPMLGLRASVSGCLIRLLSCCLLDRVAHSFFFFWPDRVRLKANLGWNYFLLSTLLLQSRIWFLFLFILWRLLISINVWQHKTVIFIFYKLWWSLSLLIFLVFNPLKCYPHCFLRNTLLRCVHELSLLLNLLQVSKSILRRVLLLQSRFVILLTALCPVLWILAACLPSKVYPFTTTSLFLGWLDCSWLFLLKLG